MTIKSSLNPDIKGITFPSDHQYVIIDTSETPKYKDLPRLAMSFWIEYSGNNIKDVPQLTLLINPQNMSLTFAKKINSSFARDGYIVEEWGEEQDVIQCSGKIGGYYVIRGSDFNGPSKISGLNRYNRSKSLSFKNLYKLLYIFRNNGAIYQNETMPRESTKLIQQSGYPYINHRIPKVIENEKNRIDRLGDVKMYYDQTIYVGAFDTFSINEDANSPYTLEYNFQFTVQRTDTTDYRTFDSTIRATLENSDVAKNSREVRTLVENAISIQKESRALEDKNLSEVTDSVADVALSKDSIASNVTPKQLAQRGVSLLRSNDMNPTIEDKEKYEKAIETINNGRIQKNVSLTNQGKQQLRDAINDTAVRENRWSTTEARSKANNLAEVMIKDLPKPKSQINKEITESTGKSIKQL